MVVDMDKNKEIEDIIGDWTHFCSTLNIGASFLDADAVRFMNEFPARLRDLGDDADGKEE